MTNILKMRMEEIAKEKRKNNLSCQEAKEAITKCEIFENMKRMLREP